MAEEKRDNEVEKTPGESPGEEKKEEKLKSEEIKEEKEFLEEKPREEVEEKTEEKPKEKTEEKAEEKTEDSEKIELLIEDLKEETEEEEKEEKKLSSRVKKFLLLFGIILSLLGIGLGIFILGRMGVFKKKTNKKVILRLETQRIKESIKKKEAEKILEKKNIKKEVEEKFLAKFQQNVYPYTFKIKDFLLPLDNKGFLDVDIILYFKKVDMEEVYRSEVLYRKFFWEVLKKVPKKMWLQDILIQKLEKEILVEMKKKGVKPCPERIKFEAVVLKG